MTSFCRSQHSSFCLLSLTHRVQCEKTENSAVAATAERNNKKDTKVIAAQSTIYKIKRLNPSKDKQNLHKQRIEEQHLQHEQQHLQQGQKSRQQDAVHHQEYKGNYKVTESGGGVTTSNKHHTKKFRKSGKNAHGLNRKLLK